jgi:formylglycine-generating enzyme required for sulfatase activity
MKLFNNRFFVTLLILSFYGIFTNLYGQRPRQLRYKAYRNLPKKSLIAVPFNTSTLSPRVGNMLNNNLIKELVKTRKFKVLNKEEGFEVEMALGSDYRAVDLFKLSNTKTTEYIIIPTIDKNNNTFEIKAQLFDVQRNEMLKSYKQECNCPFEEVVFWIVPDMAEQFGKAKLDLPKKCPDDMVLVRSGEFSMGTNHSYDNNPIKTKFTRNYCIDKYEYPNKAGELPLTGQSWYQANEKCLESRKRLCYEEEWEKACRGDYNFIYPYGNTYKKQACVTKESDIQKTGSFTECHGRIGIYDMSGNVSEWTGSLWDDNIQNKVIRGGAWSSGKENSRCPLRYSNKPAAASKTIGFRCCKSLY